MIFHLYPLLLLTLFITGSNQEDKTRTKFESGKSIVISAPMDHDIYVSAAEVTINAPVHGDVIAAGGEVLVNDTVMQDIIAAGGTLSIDGFVGDDARLAGGRVNVEGEFMGDLIIAGGDINIQRNTVVRGDLVAFGGNLTFNGLVEGNVKMYGGQASLNGKIMGDTELKGGSLYLNGEISGGSILSADEINVGGKAKFFKNVRYWHEAGELDFEGRLVNAEAEFDPNLQTDTNGRGFDNSIGVITFWVLYLLYALLSVFILIYLFDTYFERAAPNINREFIRSFGYGVLYFLAIPVLIALLMIIVVGIPIGIFLLLLYAATIFFGLTIASVAVAYLTKHKYYPHWKKGKLILFSIINFVVLSWLSLIPFFGIILVFLIVAAVYGSFIIYFRDSIRRSRVSA